MTQVSQRRNLRNKQGFDKMRLTLSAFYEYETTFCRKPLEYILEHISYLRGRFPASQCQISITHARNRRHLPTREVIPIVPRIKEVDASNNFSRSGNFRAGDTTRSRVVPVTSDGSRAGDGATTSVQTVLI